MGPIGPIHLEPVSGLMPALVVRRHRWSRFVFIVDDEDSRNASDVGGQSRQEPEGSTRSGDPGCGGQATSVDTGMAATTPSQAGLFECYDRECCRGEEQIGSGMLLSTPEARDQWYELRNGWL